MDKKIKNCLICGKELKVSKVRRVFDYKYIFCDYCNGGILLPRSKATQDIEGIYNSNYFDWGSPQGTKKFLYNIYLYRSYADWVDLESGNKNKKVLDVGAGTPDFVEEMKNRGWDSYALELAKEQSKRIAKKIGSKRVYRGYFEKIKLSNNFFDVITFWHVLEHVKFPDLTIKKARRVLNKGGKIYIEVPNVESLTWSVFGDYYDLIRVPEHLSYFSGKSIRILLEQNQFKILEISYPLKLNSAFAASFSKYIRAKTGSSQLAKIVFYLGIPFSFGLSFISSLVGRSEIVRVSAQKMI